MNGDVSPAAMKPTWLSTSAGLLRWRLARDTHLTDRVFAWTLKLAGWGMLLVLAAIAGFLVTAAMPQIRASGLAFLKTTTWDPVRDIYGALPVIFGTVASSLLALALAGPLSVGIALFVNELAPRRVGTWVGFLVEMLAAIPSVVFGLWGVFLLAPLLENVVEPGLKTYLGFLPFFQGPAYGVGMLASGIILALMILPTISSIAREVFKAIPANQREAALALGATRWEMMQLSVLRASKSGLVGAIVLGLGRALGETMAVTMVIGNRAEISASLFAPGQTMASVIANEYAEASSTLHLAALAEIGLLLFAVTFVVNSLARFLVWRVGGGGK